MGFFMDLLLVLLLTFGATYGCRKLWESRSNKGVYHCACKEYTFTQQTEHYHGVYFYHGVDLCQPHREMINR